MPIVILMPALSPTMTHGHFVKWHCSLGKKVKPGDSFFDIETDKAVMEVEAVDEGVLEAVFVEDGTTHIAVGQPLGVLREDSDTEEAFQKFLSSLRGGAPSQELFQSAPSVPSPQIVSIVDLDTPKDRVIASPLAKKIAADKGIDLTKVIGSGPRGRIVCADVEDKSSVAETTMTLTPMRSTIAKRLSESKQNIPHFYLTVECKMDALMVLRTSLKEHSINVSLNDLITRACVLALRDTPGMNNQWAGTHIQKFHNVDLAMAVSVTDGLITPIIFTAELLDFKTFVSTLHALIQRARAGQLKPSEYQGGTFTVSNLGMLGIDFFQAIINPPQSGILAIGATKQKPVVEEGILGIGYRMSATLSADHRVIDGALGAEFLTTFRKYIENPMLLLY